MICTARIRTGRFVIPGREPNRGRDQLVLDMSRSEVREYLYERISSILNEAKIDYVKWDMNRSVCDLFGHELPPERMGELYHRFVLGVYELKGAPAGTLPAAASGGLQRRRRTV